MKILAIGAHIDDVEVGCGGTLAQAYLCKHEVLILSLTGSAYNDLDGTVQRTQEEALKEGRAAADILKTNIEVMDFPTKDVPYDSTTVEAIEAKIRKFQPDVILTHWPYDTHQAHRATSLATISAARKHNSVLFYEPMTPSGRSYYPFRPQVYVGVEMEAVQMKAASLRAHTSQHEKYGTMWVDAIMARGVHRGFEIGAAHAECFEPLRWEWDLRGESHVSSTAIFNRNPPSNPFPL